jgi:hypothetical protein
MLNALSNLFIAYPSVPCVFMAVLALAVRWFSVPADRKKTEWALIISSLSLPLAASAEAAANYLSRLTPGKYDQYVYLFDAHLGQPSFALGQAIMGSKALFILASISYGLLPVIMVAILCFYLWWRPVSETLGVAKALFLNLFLAVPLYLLFPVCGPRFAFAGFPFSQPVHLIPNVISIAAAPNGVPSVHTSTALLVLWFSRRWTPLFTAAWIFLALTAFATLGSGQHYLFDLFSAVPYAVLVVWIADHSIKGTGVRALDSKSKRLVVVQ